MLYQLTSRVNNSDLVYAALSILVELPRRQYPTKVLRTIPPIIFLKTGNRLDDKSIEVDPSKA